MEHAIARRGGLAIERRTGICDHDDVVGGVETGVGERLLVRPTLAVGLDGPAGLARDHHDRAIEAFRERRPHHVGLRRVEHRQWDAGLVADDLRGERQAAHAAQDDPVQPLGRQLLAQLGDLGHQRP